MNNQSCKFCQILNKTINNQLFHDAPIYITDNFVVIPALGQFVEGILLIVAKKHIVSIGCMDKKLFQELQSLKDRVHSLLSDLYQPPVFFEHGPSSDGSSGGCCIDHAHIHVVPAKLNLVPFLSSRFNGVKLNHYSDLRCIVAGNTPYLYVEEEPNECHVFKVSVVPRQYLRQISCSYLNCQEAWDWNSYPFYDRIERMQKKINATISTPHRV